MKVKEWKKLFKNIDDEVEIILYIFDFDYDDEFPEDLGIGKVLEIEQGHGNMYINIGIHK